MPNITRLQVQNYLDSLPFNSLLQMRVTHVYRDGVRMTCALRPDLKNSHGTMHGGVWASLADTVVGMSIAAHFNLKRQSTTVELKLNYFLPITDGVLSARCKLLRIGSSLAVGSVEMFNSRKQLAGAALVTYKLL